MIVVFWLMTTLARCEAVWAIEDAIRDPAISSRWTAQEWGTAERTLKDHAIEMYLRPARKPGVEGTGAGANPKHIKFRETYLKYMRGGGPFVFAASGANQSSKTTTVGGCFCEFLRDHAADGQAFWVVAKTSQTLRDIPCKTLWELLPRSMFGDQSYNPKTGFGMSKTLLLDLPGGRGRIEVWLWTEEMQLGVIESARLAGLWWSECEWEAMFGALQPRLAKHGGWMLMDYVPRYEWQRRCIRVPAETGDPDIYHMRFCTQDNAHNLAPGVIARMRRRLSEKEQAVRIDGEEGQAFGVVFPEFETKVHVVKPFPVPNDWPRWRGMDYGYAAPTACLWFAMSPDETLYVYREHYKREWTVGQHVAAIHAQSGAEEYQDRVLIDPSAYNRTQANGMSIAAEYEKAGLKMAPAVRTNQMGMYATVEAVRLRLEQKKLKVFSSCANTIREFQSWRYKEDQDGNSIEAYEDGNDHTVDCVRYIVAQSPCFAKRVVRTADTRQRRSA